MLVTFTTKAYADITLFGDVAVRLLKMMGHSGAVPSALKAEAVPGALARLRAAVEAERQASTPVPVEAVGTDEDPPVSLSNRAFPLLELLEAAAEAGTDVLWDRDH